MLAWPDERHMRWTCSMAFVLHSTYGGIYGFSWESSHCRITIGMWENAIRAWSAFRFFMFVTTSKYCICSRTPWLVREQHIQHYVDVVSNMKKRKNRPRSDSVLPHDLSCLSSCLKYLFSYLRWTCSMAFVLHSTYGGINGFCCRTHFTRLGSKRPVRPVARPYGIHNYRAPFGFRHVERSERSEHSQQISTAPRSTGLWLSST